MHFWLKIVKKNAQIVMVYNLPYILADPIYPTPPFGQDMTQGQFLSRV